MCDHCCNYKTPSTPSSPSSLQVRQISASAGRVDQTPRFNDAKGTCCAWRQTCCGGGCCGPVSGCCSDPQSAPPPPSRSWTTPTSVSSAIPSSLMATRVDDRLCSVPGKPPMCYGGDCGGPPSESESHTSVIAEKKLCNHQTDTSMVSTIRESDR